MLLQKKRYIYPPRPMASPIPFSDIDMFRKPRYFIQTKFNDKRTTFSVDANGVEIFNRHNDAHKTYTLSEERAAEIKKAVGIIGLDTSKWNYLDGGLLDGKNKAISDTFVLWDILVQEGDWLTGSTCKDRYKLLTKNLSNEPFMVRIGDRQFDFGIKVTDNIFIPRNWDDVDAAWAFVHEVNDAAGWKNEGEPVLEGLMIKSRDGVLQIATSERNNQDWQTRCRIETGRHRF